MGSEAVLAVSGVEAALVHTFEHVSRPAPREHAERCNALVAGGGTNKEAYY